MDEREAVARALCELHIRNVRRFDTPPDELETMMAGAVVYSWPDFEPVADAAISALVPYRAEDGYARAAADIVAWLRDQSGAWSMVDVCDSMADAIERGDFRKVEA